MISTEAQLQPLKNQLIKRERLLQKLLLYRNLRLIFIHAPAGYGKTVLLQQFASRINTPVFRYQLDPTDNDPVVFFQHVFQSLARRGDCISKLDFLRYKRKPAEFSAIMKRLTDTLVEQFTANITLILEDFHFLQNRILYEWMDVLIRHLPAGAQLIISSRHTPTLKLAKLKLEGLAAEIGAPELEFTESESKLLLAFWPPLKAAPELTEWVVKQTTGWAAGMVLFLKRLEEQDPAEKADWPLLCQGYTDIFSYFENEVFSGLDFRFQQNLCRLAIVGEFTSELSDLILNRYDSWVFLEDALARHCFITRNNEGGEIYRYHPLFREFLLSRLREPRAILLQQAGHFFLQRGDYQQAIDYAFKAEDYSTAAGAVAQAGPEFLRRGQLSLVEQWLKLLESKLGLNQPRLMFLKGALLVKQGKFSEAKPWFKRVRDFCRKAGDAEVLFQTELQEIKIHRHHGHYQRSLKLLESLEQEATDPFGAAAEELNMERAMNLWLNGDLQQALLISDLVATGDAAAAERQGQNLAGVYFLTGEYSKVAECFHKSRQIKPGTGSWLLDSSSLFMTGVYRDQGEINKAVHLIEEELKERKRQKINTDLWFVYLQMALLRRDMGEPESAGLYLDQAEKMFLRSGGDKLFLGLIQIFRCLLRAESGNLPDLQPSIAHAMEYFRERGPSWQTIANYCAGLAAINLQEIHFAREKFKLSLTCAQKAGMKFYIAQSSGFLAGISRRVGDEDESLRYARECLRLSAAEQYRQPFWINPFLDEVLQIGLEQKIELNFIRDIFNKRLADHTTESFLDQKGQHGPGGLRDINPPPQLAVMKPAGKKQPVLLRIFCFGEFEVYVGNHPQTLVCWRTTKAKELLAYFIHQQFRPATRLDIITALWPEVSPEQAGTFLHTNLYWVRQVLQKSGKSQGIVFDNGGYRLEAKNMVCDMLMFDQFNNNLNRGDSGNNIQLLERAAGLYRGDYLERSGWEWALTRREEYCKKYLQILHQIVSIHCKAQNYRPALDYLERIIQINPLQEEAHQMIMKVQAALGNRPALIRQYESLRRILMEELGLEPARETRELLYEMLGEGG